VALTPPVSPCVEMERAAAGGSRTDLCGHGHILGDVLNFPTGIGGGGRYARGAGSGRDLRPAGRGRLRSRKAAATALLLHTPVTQ
jgi:hypothetical protein